MFKNKLLCHVVASWGAVMIYIGISFGQNITGVVIDMDTKENLESVLVTIKGSQSQTYTNPQGVFIISSTAYITDLPGGADLIWGGFPITVYDINSGVKYRNTSWEKLSYVISGLKSGVYILSVNGILVKMVITDSKSTITFPINENGLHGVTAKLSSICAVTTTIEAESMDLNGYILDPDYGGRTVIQVDPNQPIGSSGTATMTFNGQSGTYNIQFHACPENDGAPHVTLYIGSNQVLDVTYPTDPRFMQTYTEVYEINNVVINHGDQIRMVGTSALEGAYARVDKIVLADPHDVTLVFSKDGYIPKEVDARLGDTDLLVELSPRQQGEKPGAQNTGTSGQLTPSGGMTITQDNAVIENLDIDGCVTVEARNVTIRNCKITCGGLYGVKSTGGNNTLIENCDIGMRKRNATSLGKCILASYTTIRNCTIHNGMDGIFGYRNLTIEGNWVHSLGKDVDGETPQDPHSDGYQIDQGSNITIRGNNFDMGVSKPYSSNACCFISSGPGPINNVTIEANWLEGGNYTIYVIKHTHPNYAETAAIPTNVKIINNRFGRDYNFGVANLQGDPVVTGNVWDDTGELMSINR